MYGKDHVTYIDPEVGARYCSLAEHLYSSIFLLFQLALTRALTRHPKENPDPVIFAV